MEKKNRVVGCVAISSCLSQLLSVKMEGQCGIVIDGLKNTLWGNHHQAHQEDKLPMREMA